MGAYDNIKLTTREDLPLQRLCWGKEEERYDAHRSWL